MVRYVTTEENTFNDFFKGPSLIFLTIIAPISIFFYSKCMNIRMIAFLGNVGNTYTLTRHNSGMLFFSTIFQESQQSLQKKFHGLYGNSSIGTHQVKLLVPQTFMNESGKSVGAMAHFFNFSSEEILIIHDDLELPFTKVTLQKGGGLGGHNGLRSIVKDLGSKDFLRLRIGISRPKRGDVASYVLSRFSQEEEVMLPDVFNSGFSLIQQYLNSNPEDNLLPLSHSFL